MNPFGKGFAAIKGVFNLTRTDRRCFFPLAEAAIQARHEKISASTMKNERTAYNLLLQFCGGQLKVCDITPALIEDFDLWNKYRGISDNSRAAYMRSLRAIINRMGIHQKQALFEKVRTRRVKVTKRAIDEEDINRISALQLVPDSDTALAQALYLFCLLANGMPFIDLAFLKWENIRNGFISYRRHKTDVKVLVPVTAKLQSIIDRCGRKDSPFIFGLLTTRQPADAYRQYQNLLHRYNRELTEIETRARLSTHITSYTARHTWASLAVKYGEPLAAISKALGHTNILTTELYLKEIGVEDLRRATNRVAEVISMEGLFTDNIQASKREFCMSQRGKDYNFYRRK